MPSDAPQLIELDVLALTNGPDAIARDAGRAVFVAGAAPGDRVRARILEDRGTFARAVVVDRLVSGPHYRVPPCPWVTACGGCPWQHVAYPAQLAAKQANVRETLFRLAGVRPRRELPIIASPAEWQYRHRVRLHVDRAGRVGYLRPRSHEVVEIEGCVVGEAAIAAALPAARALVRTVTTAIDTIELASNGRGTVVAHLVASTPLVPADEDRVVAALAAPSPFAGVRITGRGWRREWGDPSIQVTTAAGGDVVQQAGTFTQVNAAANRILVDVVLAFAAGARTALDLYCGAGNLSLPLAAAGTRVVGVDRDRDAVAAAVASARAARLTNVRFESASADHFLRQQGYAGAEVVLLDPPRTGAAKAVEQLMRLRPPRIVYVSCDPATLARDVRQLARGRYIVDRVQAIDLFPQTEHVETVLEALRPPS